MKDVEILIVGAGLAGLSLARHLHRNNRSFYIIEARDRIGGRILSRPTKGQESGAKFDHGPAWFWPAQPRVAKLVEELKLTIFEQYFSGEISYEDEKGHVSRGIGFSSMQGSYRVDGGMGAITDKIAADLPHECLSLNERLTHVSAVENHIAVTTSKKPKHSITCQKLVLALPPRVVSETIDFQPALEPSATKVMKSISTWMAGHAKIIAIYEKPFWRVAGLSGDAMSRHGPMVEIHDASPMEGGPYALFGFVGIPVQYRKGQREALIQNALLQLARIFGEDAMRPVDIIMQDWAFETETASPLDHGQAHGHPQYGMPIELDNMWDGRLLLGSTEMAQHSGGYLEGALESAEYIFKSKL